MLPFILLLNTIYTSPIVGGLLFFKEECPSRPLPNSFRLLDDNNKSYKIRPENPTSINSMQWVYPTSGFTLFFHNEGEEQPYAEISGPPSTTFLGDLCKGWKPKDQNWSVKYYKDQDSKSGSLFLNEDSYVIATENQ